MARFLGFTLVLAITIAIAFVESRTAAVDVASVERQYVSRCSNNSLPGISCGNMMLNDQDRLHVNPNDCHTFYVCLAPQLPPICLECPNDLYFDAKNNLCDYPENVKCLRN